MEVLDAGDEGGSDGDDGGRGWGGEGERGKGDAEAGGKEERSDGLIIASRSAFALEGRRKEEDLLLIRCMCMNDITHSKELLR